MRLFPRQYFLTSLLNILGEAAFSSAMREPHELYLGYQYYTTDEQVYRIFLKHTAPDRQAALLDVYRRLHGGPFLDRNQACTGPPLQAYAGLAPE